MMNKAQEFFPDGTPINECFFNVSCDATQYRLSDFTLQNLQVETQNKGSAYDVVNGISVDNVLIEEIMK